MEGGLSPNENNRIPENMGTWGPYDYQHEIESKRELIKKIREKLSEPDDSNDFRNYKTQALVQLSSIQGELEEYKKIAKEESDRLRSSKDIDDINYASKMNDLSEELGELAEMAKLLVQKNQTQTLH